MICVQLSHFIPLIQGFVAEQMSQTLGRGLKCELALRALSERC